MFGRRFRRFPCSANTRARVSSSYRPTKPMSGSSASSYFPTSAATFAGSPAPSSIPMTDPRFVSASLIFAFASPKRLTTAEYFSTNVFTFAGTPSPDPMTDASSVFRLTRAVPRLAFAPQNNNIILSRARSMPDSNFNSSLGIL
eukprot:227516_1